MRRRPKKVDIDKPTGSIKEKLKRWERKQTRLELRGIQLPAPVSTLPIAENPVTVIHPRQPRME